MIRWTMSNGLTVLYRQDKDFPLTSASLLFRSGSRGEKASQAGLCSMTVDLLMQGTRRRSARRLATVLESVGASMGTQAHEDYSEMGFVVPSGEIHRALGVLAEVLEEPAFPLEEITKEKAQVLASLTSRRDAIFNLAYDHWAKALYGDHAYGHPLEGRAQTVKRFSRKDFEAWHQRYHRPETAILSLVSPLSIHAIQAQLRQSVGRWAPRPASSRDALLLDAVPIFKKTSSEDIRSSFEQAYLMVGWQAPAATHEDHVPLKVLNAILGGGMSSMLFITLREKFGLAYEVSSFYPTRLDQSAWGIYLGLPVEKLGTAASQLQRLLDRVAERGPSTADLQQARAMIRGAFLMDRQSRRRKAWYSAWWEFLGRGENYGEEFLTSIDRVSPSQVRDLFRRLQNQPRATVRVVPK